MDAANLSLPSVASLQTVTLPALDNVTNTSDCVMTGSTAWTSLHEKAFPINQQILLAISISNLVIASVGMIANAIVIFIVVRFRDMHTTTNYLFANLAVTDFIFLVTVGMLSTLDGVGVYLSHALGCWPTYLVRYASAQASSFTLCVLTYDRWRLIAYPLESLKNIPKRKRLFKISILIVWIVSFAMYIPSAFYTVEVGGRDCTLWFPWIHGQKVFHLYATIAVYAAPLVFMFILYIRIWKAILTSGINPATSSTKGKQSKVSARKRRSLRLIVFTVVTYALAWAPEKILLMLVVWDENIRGDSLIFTTGRIVTYVCIIVNCSINPFIYSFVGRGFIRHIFFWREGNQTKPQTRNVKSDQRNHNHGATTQTVPPDAAVSPGSGSLSILAARSPSMIACHIASSNSGE